MTRQRASGLILCFMGCATAALVVPQSPLCFVHFFAHDGQFEGRSAPSWLLRLNRGDDEERDRAAFALGAIGSKAAPAVPRLARMMREEPSAKLRRQASLALSKMDPASAAAVEELGQALADDDAQVRMNAAVALTRLGAAARPALPALIQALGDPNNQAYFATYSVSVQEAVAFALGRASAGTPDAVAALVAALDAPGVDRLPRAVARALAEIGPDAKTAAPALRAMLKDEEADIRQAAEEALVALGLPATADHEPSGPELPDAERCWLWDIETHGNRLNKHGFAPLARALRDADRTAIERVLSSSFVASESRSPERLGFQRGYADIARSKDAGHAPAPLSRDEFVRRLLDRRSLFQRPPSVSLAMATLAPKERAKPDGPWHGKALLRLHGEASPGAPAEATLSLLFECDRPTEENLAKPGWLRSASISQAQTSTAPQYLFAESAAKRGFDSSKLHDNWRSPSFRASTGGAYVCDFDRDGILDVLITDVTGSALYRGLPGGRFEDVTARVGLPGDTVRGAAAWIDLDGDGWEDLLLADRIYRNAGGVRFEDYTERCNLQLPDDALNFTVADYDRDGKLDLYITRSGKLHGASWLDGKTGNRRGNVLLRNLGNWRFENVTRTAGVSGDRRSTFTAAWLDADNDGWPDLHIINEFGDGVLMVNQRNGTFAPRALSDRPADFGTMGVAAGDIDNDGNIDLYCANMYSKAGTRVIGNLPRGSYPEPMMERMRRFVGGSQLHLNKGGLKFEQAGAARHVNAVGWAYAPALADFDNDGYLDIYATAGFISRDRNEPDG